MKIIFVSELMFCIFRDDAMIVKLLSLQILLAINYCFSHVTTVHRTTFNLGLLLQTLLYLFNNSGIMK